MMRIDNDQPLNQDYYLYGIVCVHDDHIENIENQCKRP